MYKFYLVLIFVLIFLSDIFVISISQYPIVLIISYDAFRFNYIDKGVTPVLAHLKNEGTHAEYLNNVFTTKTFTNHHSIATGLYPESHGVMGNSFYDSLYQEALNYSYQMWHYSDSVIPIWIANEQKGGGRHSGIMMWPGNEYNYSNTRPTHQRKWVGSVPWTQRVDGVIEWILDPKKPANLVLMYIEEPDSSSHAFGPESNRNIQELSAMDNITKYLLDRLSYFNLTNSVNIFFLSDHGMQTVTIKDIIDLRKYIDDTKYDRYEGSPILHIYPKSGQFDEVYNGLKKAVDAGAPFQVYKKPEIPVRWHYKDNRRTPPILAVANIPHVFHDFNATIAYEEKKWNFTVNENSQFGVHGYDNTEMNMKPYFIATGPLIKQKYKIEPFETIDLFSLWAHILGFPEFSANTNGSFDRVRQMLRPAPSHHPSSRNIGGALLGIFLVGGAMGTAVYFAHRKLRSRHKAFLDRFNEDSAESRQRLLDEPEEET